MIKEILSAPKTLAEAKDQILQLRWDMVKLKERIDVLVSETASLNRALSHLPAIVREARAQKSD